MDTPDSASGFENLLVWQKSHQFVLDIYNMTQHFPDSEKFGLSSQLRRAAVSIPANIEENVSTTSPKAP